MKSFLVLLCGLLVINSVSGIVDVPAILGPAPPPVPINIPALLPPVVPVNIPALLPPAVAPLPFAPTTPTIPENPTVLATPAPIPNAPSLTVEKIPSAHPILPPGATPSAIVEGFINETFRNPAVDGPSVYAEVGPDLVPAFGPVFGPGFVQTITPFFVSPQPTFRPTPAGTNTTGVEPTTPATTAEPTTPRLSGPSPGAAPTCLWGGMLVTTATGVKPLKDVKVGEVVATDGIMEPVLFSGLHRTKDGTPSNEIESIFVEVTLEDGSKILMTPLHYALTRDGEILARDLKVGDRIGDTSVVSTMLINEKGTYNPQTRSRKIKVNGVVVTTKSEMDPLQEWLPAGLLILDGLYSVLPTPIYASFVDGLSRNVLEPIYYREYTLVEASVTFVVVACIGSLMMSKH